MRVFVTGVAGFIGSHVAEQLLAGGHEVVGCDDLSTGVKENVPTGVAWSRRKVQDVDSVTCDVIVHLAAIACARWPDPVVLWQENLGATAHALRLALGAGARFVFASTAAAERGSVGDYAAAKYAAERLVLAHGGAVLRYANVYGPGQRDWGHEPGVLAAWQAAVRDGRKIRIDGDGTQTRDFIHVDDVARATALAALTGKADGRVTDICTGYQTAIRDIKTLLWGDWPTCPGERAPDDPDAVEQGPTDAAELLGFRATVILERFLAEWQ